MILLRVLVLLLLKLLTRLLWILLASLCIFSRLDLLDIFGLEDMIIFLPGPNTEFVLLLELLELN